MAQTYFQRRPDPEDRRSLFVSPTQKGADLIDRAAEVRAEEAANIVNCLKEPECVELGTVLSAQVLETGRESS